MKPDQTAPMLVWNKKHNPVISIKFKKDLFQKHPTDRIFIFADP